MRRLPILTVLVMVAGLAIVAVAGNGPPTPDAIWADGMLYSTVDTGNNLPAHGPKDGLYVFTNLQSQRPVSESKPGDRDYNGGRWQIYFINAVNPDNIPGELTSWEEVHSYINSGDLEVSGMGPSFVCPLIRQ